MNRERIAWIVASVWATGFAVNGLTISPALVLLGCAGFALAVVGAFRAKAAP